MDNALSTPNPVVESIRLRVTREKQASFLAAFLKCGNEARALKIAGLRYRDFREWMKDDDFQVRFELVRLELVGEVEETAWNAAKAGHFPFANLMLKAHRPERYAQSNEVKHSGTIGVKAEDIVKSLAQGERDGPQKAETEQETVLTVPYEPAKSAAG